MGEMLTHVDLFSGIGGFALAAQWTGFRTIAFCEIEPFCQEVLKARFGAIADTASIRRNGNHAQGQGIQLQNETRREIGAGDFPTLIPDIRDFDGTQFRGATLLTGGVPCQPASIAGKRKGTADDRWLWPEAIRVLVEVKPVWAIFENPCGILSLEQGVVFENLLSQMEGEGYEVRPIIIPACAVNAPHRRDRVWIVGHANGKRPQGHGEYGECPRERTIGAADSDASDSAEQRLSKSRLAGFGELSTEGQAGIHYRPEQQDWDILWIEVATRLCRVDARVSNRVDRLKALGNAIVPQVAYEIIKEIARIEYDR